MSQSPSEGGVRYDRLQELFNTTPDAIMLHDSGGTILDANDQAVESLGYDREELTSMRVSDIETAFSQEELRSFWTEMDVDDREMIEGTHRRKDGTTFPVELSIRYTVIDGDHLFLTLSRDITERKRREAELERHVSIVEESTDITTILDPDGTITYVSPAVEHVLGYDPGKLVGENSFEFQHPDDQDDVAAAIESVSENPDEPQTVEVRFRDTDGDWHWIEARMRNFLDDESIDGILVNSREVTQRKEREREIRELSREYEALLENADDAIFLVDVEDADDLTFRFERLSHSHEETSGLTTESVRGKRPRDVFDGDVAAEIVANYRRCVEAGEPITYEETLPMAAGDIVWQTSLAPVVVDGEVTRIVGIARDITERKDHEHNLDRYEAYIEEASDIVIEVDDSGTIEYVSPSVERILGYEPEELVGTIGFDLLHPEDIDACREQFADLLSGSEETLTVEARFQRADGQYHWLQVRGTNQLANPAIDGIVTRARDVAQRKESERELRLFKKAVEQAAHAVYITDTDGTIEYVNPAFEEITGYSKEDAVGRTPRILKSGEKGEAYYADLWETLLAGEGWEEEVPNQRASGDIYYADQTIAPICEDGEPTRFVAIQQDITERKERERELRLFKEAVDQTGHSVYITDTDGTIEYVNPAFEETTGYSREEAIGQTPALLNSGEHDEELFGELWETILNGEVWRQELINERADGEMYYVDQTIAPIETENGDIEAFVAVNRDISERKEMENELRRRETRFRMMFERHSAPMLLIDPDSGAIENANEAAVEYYGYGAEELTEMDVQDINSMSPEAVAEERERAKEQDRNHFIFEHELASGDIRTVEVHSSPIQFERDDLLFSIINDITAQKEYEQELERYERLVENLPIGVSQNTPGPDGEFRLLNEAMVEMFDADSKADLRAHSVSDLYLDPTERATFSNRLSEEGLVREEELELRTLSGDEIWGSVTAMTREVDGETVFDCAIQDMTERKKRERELRETRDFLDQIFESMPFGVYVLDAEDYSIEHANSRAITEEGKTCYEVTHQRDEPCDQGEGTTWDCPLSEVVETGEPASAEHVHYDETGEIGVYQVYTSPILNEDGEVEQVVESNVDISERKQYEQQLKEQRDDLEILNQVVRHDIRNDLQIVTTYVGLLADQIDDESEQAGYVETIRKSARDAVELTKTARDLAEVMLTDESKIQARTLQEPLESELESARTDHPEAVIAVDGPIPPVSVRANQLLGSVFRNLLKNAVQHNDKAIPEVTVSVRRLEDTTQVRIADNGPGVPNYQKESIFGKGEKGLESEGTGVGLYLVQTLVDSYGGAVWVEDNNPRGSVFVVELPVAKRDTGWSTD